MYGNARRVLFQKNQRKAGKESQRGRKKEGYYLFAGQDFVVLA